MAEPRRQGWGVPQRAPAIAAAGVVTTVLVLVSIAGWTYMHTLGAHRRAPVHVFPAPGVESYIHDGAADPLRPAATTTPDPAIEAAKRAVVRDGIAGWPR